jgi:2-methylcitrate dehydratase PrpD
VTLHEFAVVAAPPPAAREAAARAVLDTIGVTLAGASQPAARIVQSVIEAERGHDSGSCAAGPCRVVGVGARASAGNAALANGTAAHAHDFDDMCFVSLAHPSAPLVSAAWAAAELAAAPGRALLDAYVVGFEIEGRLGRAMNPRHYRRGWHCTSTLGTIGAAAAVSRLLGLDAPATGHALAIAASQASGLKENFGTMVKPLHGGLAARSGVMAGLLARAGMTASATAIEGGQGFLAAMDSESASLDAFVADLGSRWEILDTGITVKLYPSCAATHPSLDAVLDLRRRERFQSVDVESVEVGVDAITPTVLLYDRPVSGLEAKFSLPFCLAAAIVDGCVGLQTFEAAHLYDPRVVALQARVRMSVDPSLDPSAPALTQARVTVRLKDGRVLTASANGARGYPDRPASDAELAAKFLSCAQEAMPLPEAEQALHVLREIEMSSDIRTVTDRLQPSI